MYKIFSFFMALFLFWNNAWAKDILKNQELELSLSLLKDNIEKRDDNFIVSPFSVYVIADMLANGAKGKTLQGLQNEILDKSGTISLESINQALKSQIKKQSSATEINNSIWGNNFKDDYKKIKKSLFVEIFDLPSNTGIINNWVREKTHGLIKDILNPTITQEDDLFLVNTVYFKDGWKKQFDKKDTKRKKFYSIRKGLIPAFVKMMYLEDNRIDYYENAQFQAIRLVYKKGDYIDIILPKEKVDFVQFVKKLTIDDLNFSYRNEKVHISLPRFETEYSFSLNNFIRNLNIPISKDDEGVDFSAMCEKCFVKDIVQKAKIQLDEEGTVAAAATMVVMDSFGSAMEDNYKIFNANRPFIYIINDGLFVGVYMQGKMF